MKSKLLGLAGTLALLAVIGKFYAGPAIAQTVRAALVKNIDERGRSPYTQRLVCGTSGGSCVASGPTVPANTRLVVEHVTGRFEVTDGLLPGVQMATKEGFFFLPPTFSLRLAGIGDFYVVNQPVLAYFDAGSFPTLSVVSATNTGSVEIDALITGYTVNLSE